MHFENVNGPFVATGWTAVLWLESLGTVGGGASGREISRRGPGIFVARAFLLPGKNRVQGGHKKIWGKGGILLGASLTDSATLWGT